MTSTTNAKEFRRGSRGQYLVYPRPLDPTPQIKVEIDDEFVRLMPALGDDELNQLLESLVAEDCREPLIAWEYDGRYVLLDGHNRMALCTAENIPYEVNVKSIEDIPDRQAAIAWIMRNQLGRRNLTREQFTLYLGKLYNARKPRQGGTGANQHQEQTGHCDRSARQLAQDHGISERTVRRAGEFAEAVGKAKEQDPDIERKVINGEVTHKEVVRKAKPVEAEEGHATPMMDKDGVRIPEDLRDVFTEADFFAQFASDLTHFKRRVHERIEANPTAWSNFNHQGFDAMISDWRHNLILARPFLICSTCGGIDSSRCRECGGRRFLSKFQSFATAIELRNSARRVTGLPPVERSQTDDD